MIALTLADSDAPRMSRNMHAKTTTIAGMLNTPPSPGGLEYAAGIVTPKAPRNSLRYSPQPTATAATETPYSSMSIHPTAHATISPRVT